MSDLIDRQATLDSIEKIRQGLQMMDDTHRADIIMGGVYLCEKAVRHQPSVSPQRMRGKWIDVNGDNSLFRCTVCNNLVCCAKNNYCPNCGVPMRTEVTQNEA